MPPFLEGTISRECPYYKLISLIVQCRQHLLVQLKRDLKSINQSNFYSTNIPGEARLSGATAKLVFNSQIKDTCP